MLSSPRGTDLRGREDRYVDALLSQAGTADVYRELGLCLGFSHHAIAEHVSVFVWF
jgi:hypothetical protein